MSVILTASRKAVKSAKPKKKKSQPAQHHHHHQQQQPAPKPSVAQQPARKSLGENQTPPQSSSRTTVWHWELDGDPCTVMFNKEKNEVWCNGEDLDTDDSFCVDEDGGVIEFPIHTLDGHVVHNARIIRISSGDRHDGLTHQLYVDGYMILEHNASNPYSVDDPLKPIEEGACGPPPPPPYYETARPAGNGSSFSPPFETKKTK